jgi:putative oxidoreductase
MKFLVPIGRLLFSLIFLPTLVTHFSSGTIQYAASAGVPIPGFLVPLSGIIAFLGGMSILLGFKSRIGAWLLIIFLIPVTLFMHHFWTFQDPASYQMQKVNFMKNLSLIGASLLISYFGSGPYSIDRKLNKSE